MPIVRTPLLSEETLDTLDTHFSMLLFKIPPVIPTQASWLAMLIFISILGLITQVCSSLHSSSDPGNLL